MIITEIFFVCICLLAQLFEAQLAPGGCGNMIRDAESGNNIESR